jgi:hypothetical protein
VRDKENPGCFFQRCCEHCISLHAVATLLPQLMLLLLLLLLLLLQCLSATSS